MGPALALRLGVSMRLEAGAWDGPVARAASRAWGAIATRRVARPLVWRQGVRVVAVGGATLGGSGRTPVAIACAEALAAAGARVALVAHAYRARPGMARVVGGHDDVRLVGDEALVAARALGGAAHVVVAPSRQRALDLAARLADVVVLDGVNQTAPRRASLALLALQPDDPWGAGASPPAGDLRAPPATLLAASDLEVSALPVPSIGASLGSGIVRWEEIAKLRTGLFVALARPMRIVSHLARHGVVPMRTAAIADHGPLPRSLARQLARNTAVDLWLATAKCATHLEAHGVPHAVLSHRIELGPPVLGALRRLA